MNYNELDRYTRARSAMRGQALTRAQRRRGPAYVALTLILLAAFLIFSHASRGL